MNTLKPNSIRLSKSDTSEEHIVKVIANNSTYGMTSNVQKENKINSIQILKDYKDPSIASEMFGITIQYHMSEFVMHCKGIDKCLEMANSKIFKSGIKFIESIVRIILDSKRATNADKEIMTSIIQYIFESLDIDLYTLNSPNEVEVIEIFNLVQELCDSF